MKQYVVTKAFSVIEKALLIPEDKVYAEKDRLMYNIYNEKTRKRIGRIGVDKFEESTIEAVNFKIYDNTEPKKEIINLLNQIAGNSKSKAVKDTCGTLYNFIKTKF